MKTIKTADALNEECNALATYLEQRGMEYSDFTIIIIATLAKMCQVTSDNSGDQTPEDRLRFYTDKARELLGYMRHKH